MFSSWGDLLVVPVASFLLLDGQGYEPVVADMMQIGLFVVAGSEGIAMVSSAVRLHLSGTSFLSIKRKQ